MKRSIFAAGLAFSMVMIVAGCKGKDDRVACDGSSPTWNGQVQDIVVNSCVSSSCHGSGSSRGDYSTYNGIKSDLLNGKFETEVLETRRMPQGDVFADSVLAKLQCWLENGFPES